MYFIRYQYNKLRQCKYILVIKKILKWLDHIFKKALGVSLF